MTAITQQPGQLARRTVHDLTHPIFIKQMLWVGLYALVMVGILLVNIHFLKTYYPNPAQPDDLVLDIIPETRGFIVAGEVFSAMLFMTIAFLLWQNRFVALPKLLFLLVTMYIIRAFAIVLTPLAQIQPPSANYSETHILAQTFYHGMFFSGHTASAFIQAFYFKNHRLRPVLFILAGAMAFSLLASHSHYSIDVFGGVFVAYFVTHFDWMRLVPHPLRTVRWMPWYTGDDAPQPAPQP